MPRMPLWFLLIPSALSLLTLHLPAAIRTYIIVTILSLVFAGSQTRQPLVLEEHYDRRAFTPEESGPVGLDLLPAHLAGVFAMEKSP